MGRHAAESVMRAYRNGYTRQAVRLRLDAAYSGQEDLRLGQFLVVMWKIDDIDTMWGPPVISWFKNPINYSYKYHKP
jgi:hypothetical protein